MLQNVCARLIDGKHAPVGRNGADQCVSALEQISPELAFGQGFVEAALKRLVDIAEVLLGSHTCRDVHCHAYGRHRAIVSVTAGGTAAPPPRSR